MDIKEIKQKIFDVKFAIATLNVKERQNMEHPLYKELKDLKRLYALTLFEEKEKERNENEQHKTR